VCRRRSPSSACSATRSDDVFVPTSIVAMRIRVSGFWFFCFWFRGHASAFVGRPSSPTRVPVLSSARPMGRVAKEGAKRGLHLDGAECT
jgi:hypothetical protein